MRPRRFAFSLRHFLFFFGFSKAGFGGAPSAFATFTVKSLDVFNLNDTKFWRRSFLVGSVAFMVMVTRFIISRISDNNSSESFSYSVIGVLQKGLLATSRQPTEA